MEDLKSIASSFDNNLITAYNYYNPKPVKDVLLRHPFGALQQKCEQVLVINSMRSI